MKLIGHCLQPDVSEKKTSLPEANRLMRPCQARADVPRTRVTANWGCGATGVTVWIRWGNP